MILRKSTLLLLLSIGSANAYFAEVNNAHITQVFAASNGDAVAAAGGAGVETVDDRSSLQHGTVSLWAALEDALEHKSELGFAAPKIMEAFEEWVVEFEREYENLQEKSKRMLIWLENHVLIETHNAKESSSFTLGHNDFSDMTHEEFKQRMHLGEFAPPLVMREGKQFNFAEFEEEKEADEVSNARLRGAADAESTAAKEERRLADTDLDEEDWHGKGLMGPVRNQGICGACWAFSAIGSIESGMAIDKYNKMTPHEREELEKQQLEGVEVTNDLGLVVPLSEQNMIDCDVLMEKGCGGGLMTTAFEEEEVKKGLCSEVDYPYLQTQGTCASDACSPVPGSLVKNHVDIVPRKNNALKEALKTKPVTAAMVASDPMFQFYHSGIYSVEGCGKVTKQMGAPDCNVLYEGQDVCLPDINHGVLVVGYGEDDTVTGDVKTFFKVKNSWGEKWGDGGYFRLARYEVDKTDPMENWGECAILTLLSYPVME
mmetsp:Transcript_26803/g.34325  ORF Transcript_26803/g.34325 Transcript_26803/m.34325 type:complete len:487 (+) Transcript_26803:44-1504(+)